MKKLLTLLAIVALFSTAVHAQPVQSSPVLDSINTSSSTGTVILKLPVSDGVYSIYSTQIVATKASGTVSAKAYLQRSLNNVNFVTVDSLTIADQAGDQFVISDQGPAKGYYYRWYCTVPSSTQKFYLKAWLWKK